MSEMQTPADGNGGRCGLRDPDKIKPHPTISPTISQAIRPSEDGETALAAGIACCPGADVNCAFVSQINAIARLCVTETGDGESPESQLLAIGQALAVAVEAIDGHLRWRREAQWERRGSHSEESE